MEFVIKSLYCRYSVESLNGLSFKIVASERILLPMFQQLLIPTLKLIFNSPYSDQREQVGFERACVRAPDRLKSQKVHFISGVNDVHLY